MAKIWTQWGELFSRQPVHVHRPTVIGLSIWSSRGRIGANVFSTKKFQRKVFCKCFRKNVCSCFSVYFLSKTGCFFTELYDRITVLPILCFLRIALIFSLSASKYSSSNFTQCPIPATLIGFLLALKCFRSFDSDPG